MSSHPKHHRNSIFKMRQALTWCLALLALVHAGKQPHQQGGKRHHVSSNDSGDQRRFSPDELGLRSSSSVDIPILIETVGKIYDPKPSDINATVLRQRMGKLFDTTFTSIHKPLYLKNYLDYDYPFRKNRRGRLVAREPKQLPDWLKKLRFRHIWLPDGTKAHTSVGSARLEKKLQTYLWAHTSCPVIFKWRDLGKRFWPRWLREGHCINGKQSCSIPPGMHCQPSNKQYIQILRWHCNDWDTAKGCQWRTIHHPVITKCDCRCPKND